MSEKEFISSIDTKSVVVHQETFVDKFFYFIDRFKNSLEHARFYTAETHIEIAKEYINIGYHINLFSIDEWEKLNCILIDAKMGNWDKVAEQKKEWLPDE